MGLSIRETQREREDICAMLAAGDSVNYISAQLQIDPEIVKEVDREIAARKCPDCETVGGHSPTCWLVDNGYTHKAGKLSE